ncbi:MAG: adenosylmethionine decarboxylase [Alphaproteobacteria bacterium]
MAPKVSFKDSVLRGDCESGEVPRRDHNLSPLPQRARRADPETARADYFVERDGLLFAGTHLLVDLWNARNLDDQKIIEQALTEAVEACGATLLHVHLHHFSPSGGISGVAVLAESHISIHTWPERGFAAVDIFMCGTCDPYRAVPVLRRVLATDTIQLTEQKRGLEP